MKRSVLTFTALALALTGCAASNESAAVPASWQLEQPESLNANSTTLSLAVSRQECAGGVTGELREPQIRYEAKQILISIQVDELADGPQTCQDNAVVQTSVELDKPIGERSLVDESCLADAATTLSECSTNGIRWEPAGNNS